MLFDHFLTPHPRGAASAGQTSSASEQRLRRDADVRRRENTFFLSADRKNVFSLMGKVMGMVLVIKMPA